MPSASKPLSGKSIVVTRARDQAAEFARLIEASGGRVVLLPSIEIQPPADWDTADQAIAALSSYDGVIFTSANGVEGFIGRLGQLGRLGRLGQSAAELLDGKRIFAIGPITSAALAERGIGSVLTPAGHTSTGLSRELESGAVYLFPCGDLARDTLAKSAGRLGGRVDRVTVYRTVMPGGPGGTGANGARPFETAAAAGPVDCITFTSPSAVKNFSELAAVHGPAAMDAMIDGAAVAVIGPTTAAAASALGWEPKIVSTQPTASSLVDAICEYFRRGPNSAMTRS